MIIFTSTCINCKKRKTIEIAVTKRKLKQYSFFHILSLEEEVKRNISIKTAKIFSSEGKREEENDDENSRN